MIESDSDPQGFSALNSPSTLDSRSLRDLADDFTPRIDGYDVEERLGEGGMGTVWKAMQLSTRRRVAIKLLSRGVFSEKARLRFDREVEMTARLEHPHIARIYDSGTREGHYFYVMELIEGLPLDEYIRSKRLPDRHTLLLMHDILLSVQHAHQRGIIHRDLKPSNILVDKSGQAHLLDFGLAIPLLDESMQRMTMDEQVLGTPQFMSPEQAAGRGRDLDTRSDIYSLGATLFLLLTGSFPHDDSGSRLDCIRRIAEQAPRRPRAIAETIDADLEAMLLKALSRDPEQRYRSASEFAQDIANYLNGDPLIARRATMSYLLRKQIRKHWAAIAITTTILLLLAGLSVFAHVRIGEQKRAADRSNIAAQAEREVAEQQTATAKEVNNFLIEMLSAADPNRVLGEKVTILQATEEAIKKLDAGALKDQPLTEAAVRSAIGVTMRNLSRHAEAEPNFRKAIELRRKASPPDDPDLATNMNDLAWALSLLGRSDEAKPLILEASQIEQRNLDRQRKTLAPDDPAIADTLNKLGAYYYLHVPGGLSEAEKMWQEALTIRRKSLPANHIDIAWSARNLGYVLNTEGKAREAEPYFREALEIRRKALPPNHPDIAASTHELGRVEHGLGRFAQAEALYREAGTLFHKALPENHTVHPEVLRDLARVLQDRRRPDEAEAAWRQALALERAHLPRGDPSTLDTIYSLADLLMVQTKPEQAEPLFREGLQLTMSTGASPETMVRFQSRLGELLVQEAKYDDAEQLLLKAYAALPDGPPPLSVQRREVSDILYKMYVAEGKPKAAAEWRSDADNQSHQ